MADMTVPSLVLEVLCLGTILLTTCWGVGVGLFALRLRTRLMVLEKRVAAAEALVATVRATGEQLQRSSRLVEGHQAKLVARLQRHLGKKYFLQREVLLCDVVHPGLAATPDGRLVRADSPIAQYVQEHPELLPEGLAFDTLARLHRERAWIAMPLSTVEAALDAMT